MSILDKESKKMLVESMRSHLGHILKESTTLTAAQATQKCKFLNEQATYEQLLNITLNPHRTQKYLPDYVLEGALAILHSACLTGRKNIGKNAIAEGSLRLSKKIGAVITESMMDAALTMVNEGCGLEIISDLMKKVQVVTETKLSDLRNATMIGWDKLGEAGARDVAAKLAGMGLTSAQQAEIIAQLKGGATFQDIRPALFQFRTQNQMNNPNITKRAYDNLAKRMERGLSNVGNNGVTNTRINSNAINTTVDQLAKKGRMNPLFAAGLGAAALGGGMLAYKKFKDNQNAAMQG